MIRSVSNPTCRLLFCEAYPYLINRVRSYALPTVRYSHSPKPASLAYASFRFPETWPVYTPALKLAGWLEFYADVLELNIWTSSTITSIRQDPQTSKWDVEIKRGDGTERKFTVNHVVFCTGLGSGVPNTPTYPGMVSILYSFSVLSFLLIIEYRTNSRAKYCTPRNTSAQSIMRGRKW